MSRVLGFWALGLGFLGLGIGFRAQGLGIGSAGLGSELRVQAGIGHCCGNAHCSSARRKSKECKRAGTKCTTTALYFNTVGCNSLQTCQHFPMKEKK